MKCGTFLRRRHYSIRTEKIYCDWAKRCILQGAVEPRTDPSSLCYAEARTNRH